AMALGSCVTPDLIRVTTPYSWSVPISNGTPAGNLAPAACNPAVSLLTCVADCTLVVGLVPPVGSSAEKLTRIRPPSRYLATISAGVATPASLRLAAAEAAVTVFASLPYAYGMSTWPTRSVSSSWAAMAAARAARSSLGGGAPDPVEPGGGPA